MKFPCLLIRSQLKLPVGLNIGRWSAEVTLGPGKLALRLAIERWINLRSERWYCGDTTVFLMTPHAALLEAAVEDLAVVNLLATEWGNVKEGIPVTLPNIVAFSGQRPILEMPDHIVVVNTTNYAGLLGSLSLLNCHRAVYPLSATSEGYDPFTRGRRSTTGPLMIGAISAIGKVASFSGPDSGSA